MNLPVVLSPVIASVFALFDAGVPPKAAATLKMGAADTGAYSPTDNAAPASYAHTIELQGIFLPVGEGTTQTLTNQDNGPAEGLTLTKDTLVVLAADLPDGAAPAERDVVTMAGEDWDISALNLGINGAAAAAHPGKVTSWRLQTNAGLRARPNVQSDISDQMGLGEFGVTVTVSGYLQDAALHDACLGHQDVSMDLLVADSLGNSYHFFIDRATISDHTGNAGAKNQDVINNYTITGYGPNALRIVRAAAS